MYTEKQVLFVPLPTYSYYGCGKEAGSFSKEVVEEKGIRKQD